MFVTNNRRRLSENFGSGLSYSQEEVSAKRPRASIDAGGTGSRRALETGVAPSSIANLYASRSGATIKLYGSAEVGPASLVGVPFAVKLVSDNLIQFDLTDGTGQVTVKVDLPSDQPWLKQLLLDQLPSTESMKEGENRPPWVVSPVRAVGIPEPPTGTEGKITLRALHVRKASPEEYGYFHTIYTCYAIGKLKTPHAKSGDQQSTLPKRFQHVESACQRWILSTILERREESLGLSMSELINAGKSSGYDEDAIRQEISELDNAALVVVIDGNSSTFVDVMPED